MAYSTTLNVAQRSGAGEPAKDELVGTGDGSQDSYDLANDNIISGSYTLSYAAAGSNDFTALVETTDYALDKSTGRILLTPTGVSTLGTNKLYANYWYITANFTDEQIAEYIAIADERIDIITGRKWDGPQALIEYQDGFRSSRYPTTDMPYMSDRLRSDQITTRQWPIYKVDALYYLAAPTGVGQFWNYDDSGTSFTDKTQAVNTSTEAPFTAFASTPAIGDIIYIGNSVPFLGLDINLATNGTGSPAITWEYWNGSAWAAVSVTETETGSSSLTASGRFGYTYPYGWVKNTVNAVPAYYLRGRLTAGYTVAPEIATITITDALNTILEPRQIEWKRDGRIVIKGSSIPEGRNNIRIDYQYGEATTPDYITQLSTLLASVSVFIGISGGSYDDATSYTLGSKAVTIGEAWVNIQNVLKEIRAEINDILKDIGKRANLEVI